MASGPISSPWWSTMQHKTSPISSGAKTWPVTPHGRSFCSKCSGCQGRAIFIRRSCWPRMATSFRSRPERYLSTCATRSSPCAQPARCSTSRPSVRPSATGWPAPSHSGAVVGRCHDRAAIRHEWHHSPFGSCRKNSTMQTTASGLQYDDRVPGTGKLAEAGRPISVHYTGWLYEDGVKGAKFDSSKDRNDPFEFDLGVGMVIKGWDEGVQGMQEGGTRVLVIPPQLGY